MISLRCARNSPRCSREPFVNEEVKHSEKKRWRSGRGGKRTAASKKARRVTAVKDDVRRPPILNLCGIHREGSQVREGNG